MKNPAVSYTLGLRGCLSGGRTTPMTPPPCREKNWPRPHEHAVSPSYGFRPSTRATTERRSALRGVRSSLPYSSMGTCVRGRAIPQEHVHRSDDHPTDECQDLRRIHAPGIAEARERSMTRLPPERPSDDGP
jgi:hypothetical protein